MSDLPSRTEPDDDEALAEALEAYERLQQQRLDEVRARVLAAFPRIAEDLQAYFEMEDRIESLHEPDDAMLAAVREDQRAPAPATEPIPRTSDAPQIEGFRVMQLLGEGAMGLVYEAHEEAADRSVALKVMREHWQDYPELCERFLDEARAAAGLTHAGIIKVHRVGQVGEVPFYTMELARGGTLEERLERAQRDHRWLAETMAAVADSVDYEHRQGFLHRDLKPTNILFDEHDRPLVGDFGLAFRIEDSLDDTQAAAWGLGTPAYMAPEIARRPPEPPSVAADIWSLGAVMFHALTGKPPVDESVHTRLLESIASLECVDQAALPPTVHPDLQAIVMRCLAIDPQERYHHAASLASDLRRHLAGHPVEARPQGAIGRTRYWFKRNPWAAPLLILGAIATAAVVSATNASRRAVAQQQEERARDLLHEAYVAADAGRRDRGALYFAESAARHPTQVARAGLLAQPHDVPLAILRPDGGSVWRLAYDPTGRRLVAACENGRVVVWDVETRRALYRLDRHEFSVRAVAFDRQGNLLATGDSRGTLRVFDLRGAEARLLAERLSPPHRAGEPSIADEVHGIGFSAVPGQVLAAGRRGVLRIWNYLGDAVTRIPYDSASRCDIRTLRMNADGTRALVGAIRLDVEPGDRVALGEARLFDVPVRRFLAPAEVVEGTPWDGAFVANRGLAVISDDMGLRFLGLAGHEPPDPIPTDAAVGSVAVDASGSWLLAGDTSGQAQLYSLQTRRPVGEPLHHWGAVYCVAFHPSGDSMATAGQDGLVRLWARPRGAPALRRFHAPPSIDHIAVRRGGDEQAIVHDNGRRVRFPSTSPASDEDALESPGRVLAIQATPRGWVAVVHETDPGSTTSIWRIEATGARHEWRDRTPLSTTIHPESATLALGARTLCLRGRGAVSELWHLDDTDTWQRTHELSPTRIFEISPRGRMAVASEDGQRFQVFPSSSPSSTQWLRTSQPALRVAISDDGTRLASLDIDGEAASLWDVATGASLGDLPHDEIEDTRFVPDNDLLVTAGGDGIVRFWRTGDGARIGGPLIHRQNQGGTARAARIGGLAFADGGRHLVTWTRTAGVQRSAHRWRLDWIESGRFTTLPAGALEAARLTAIRQLTDEDSLLELDAASWTRLYARWQALRGR